MYLTSDLHFFHKGVLKFCPDTRPFCDVDEMNQYLVDRWNEKACKAGIKMYHLGDFSFGKPVKTREIVSQLKGDITFIRGNHDFDKNAEILQEYGEVVDYKKVNYQGKKIPDKFELGKAMNVGYDAIGKIIHFDEVLEIMDGVDIGFCSHLG